MVLIVADSEYFMRLSNVFVFQDMKEKLTDIHTALGVSQIFVMLSALRNVFY